MRRAFALFLLFAAACDDGGIAASTCSIDLDVSPWTEPQPGVFERVAVGPLDPADVDDGVPVVGDMCRVHSATRGIDTSMLVEDVGVWTQDFAGHADPQSYVAFTHARVAEIAVVEKRGSK
jgi:hypothetical protein